MNAWDKELLVRPAGRAGGPPLHIEGWPEGRGAGRRAAPTSKAGWRAAPTHRNASPGKGAVSNPR